MLPYGRNDNSYKAAGELAGITALVELFYQTMDKHQQAKVIRAMHTQELSMSKQKLSYFLSGWLGGPKLYSEHYGAINIPCAHRHLAVNEAARDAWILCMTIAVEQQPYAEDFKHYLIEQLKIPAERIRQACA